MEVITFDNLLPVYKSTCNGLF